MCICKYIYICTNLHIYIYNYIYILRKTIQLKYIEALRPWTLMNCRREPECWSRHSQRISQAPPAINALRICALLSICRKAREKRGWKDIIVRPEYFGLSKLIHISLYIYINIRLYWNWLRAEFKTNVRTEMRYWEVNMCCYHASMNRNIKRAQAGICI